ncbi:14386_t:CDS:1 [Gigaspora margarita]|uniref:14386_t:CDS:1 n=1 Tax=Gigaspora margarita TaxID=4874 RepID=A0ABN7VJ64_GIGMA|nr:14386_t:CDS:1 [Gigaspora margarita]
MDDTGSFKIRVPFPPAIDVKDLIDSKPNRDKTPRCPNAFIIYRKVFSETARNEGYYLPMTVVSSLASKSWEKEPEEVQAYYKQLSKKAFEYRNEKFPKVIKRKKQKRGWNVISFHVPTNFEAQNTAKKEDKIVQFQQDLEDVIDFGNLATPELSSNASTASSSPISDQLFPVEEGMIQNVYPSPNFSSVHNNALLDFTSFSSNEQTNFNNEFIEMSQSFENFLPLQESQFISIDPNNQNYQSNQNNQYYQSNQSNQTEVYLPIDQNCYDTLQFGLLPQEFNMSSLPEFNMSSPEFNMSSSPEFNLSSAPEFNLFSQNISLDNEAFGSNEMFDTFGIITPNINNSYDEFKFSNSD